MQNRRFSSWRPAIALLAAVLTVSCSSAESPTGARSQQAATPAVTASPATVQTGGTITGTVADGPGSPTDWVGLFRVGDPATAARDWQYLNGTKTAPTTGMTMATLSFTAPGTAGSYELRLLSSDSYNVIATSSAVQVTAPTLMTTIAATPTVGPNAPIAVTVSGGPGNPTDWVGLFAAGADNTNALDWQYFNGTKTAPAMGLTSAMLTFTSPSRPGAYELRVLTANSYNSIASSNPVQVMAGAGTTISASPSMVVAGGAIIVTLSGGPGNATDWVGLYRQGDPNTNAFDWQYLNGTKTAPAMGQSSATLTFTAPSRDGTYELRLLTADSYNSVATSNAVTVGAGGTSLAVSATMAMPGAPVTVTLTGGPGDPTDWLALAKEGSNDRILLDWAYLNGTQTAPAMGLASASVTFTLPMEPGRYLFRLFARDGFQKLATSPVVVVQ